MDINALREYLIREQGITKEQYEKEVSELRRQGVRSDVESIATVESLQMQLLDQQSDIISTLMRKINELEAKVDA